MFSNNFVSGGDNGNGARGGLIAINDFTPGTEARNVNITDNILKGIGEYN